MPTFEYSFSSLFCFVYLNPDISIQFTGKYRTFFADLSYCILSSRGRHTYSFEPIQNEKIKNY